MDCGVNEHGRMGLKGKQNRQIEGYDTFKTEKLFMQRVLETCK